MSGGRRTSRSVSASLATGRPHEFKRGAHHRADRFGAADRFGLIRDPSVKGSKVFSLQANLYRHPNAGRWPTS
jgi:hypothetical protein